MDKELIKSLIEKHQMESHPEGGHYVEVFRNDNVTHIYFLLEEHEKSHWHRITKTETLHFYSGSPLNVYTSKDGIDFQVYEIGSNNNFMLTVAKGTWFALKSTGAYSLIGCTVAPAFEFEDLELAPKDWKPLKFNQKL